MWLGELFDLCSCLLGFVKQPPDMARPLSLIIHSASPWLSVRSWPVWMCHWEACCVDGTMFDELNTFVFVLTNTFYTVEKLGCCVIIISLMVKKY